MKYLSWAEQGMIRWMLDQKGQPFSFSDILEATPCGVTHCQSVIRELKRKGYLTTTRIAIPGRGSRLVYQPSDPSKT